MMKTKIPPKRNPLRWYTKVMSLTLSLLVGGYLALQALPQGSLGADRTAFAAGSVYGDRPLVGVINYSGLTGQNKIWDQASLTPPAYNERLPFYAVVTDDDSRVARTGNTAQEFVYHTSADITNFHVFAAFDDSKSYNLSQDIQIYSSSDGVTYTAAPSSGLSGKTVQEIAGATNWQKVNISTAYEPGVRYVKVVIAKTDDGPLNPQIMRVELYHRNTAQTDLVRIVDNLDDYSKMYSRSAGITLASSNPEKFSLVAADDNEASIVDQQIAYANSAHIDYMAFLDMRTNWYTQTPRVFDFYRQSANKGNLKYAIIMGNPASDGETWADKRARLLEYFADSFYVRVHDDRPLLYLYSLPDWSKSQVDQLRSASISAGLGDPYVVGMTSSSSYSSFIDGASEYAAVEAGVVYNDGGTSHSIPLVSLGVNDEPRQDNPPSWGAWGPDEPPVTPSQLEDDLTEALDWTVAHSSQNPANTVLIYAWNEHAEAASNVEPTLNANGTVNTTLLDTIGGVLEDYESSGTPTGNLLTNGDFESGTTGWSGQAGSISSETGSVHAGSKAVLVTGRTDPWGSAVQDVKSVLLANGQGDYSASAWARYASGSDPTSIILNTVDSGGSHWFNLGYATVGTSYTHISGNTDISWTGTLSSATIYLQGSSSTANLYIDDFSLSKYVAVSNLLTNGDFESGTTGWSGQASSISSETGSVHAGSRAVLAASRTDPWGSPAQDIKNLLLANGQGTYSASAWVKYASGSDPTVIMIQLNDSNGDHWFGIGYTTVGASYTPLSGNANITWTGTLSSATIYIQGNSSTSNLYVDDFTLSKL